MNESEIKTTQQNLWGVAKAIIILFPKLDDIDETNS